jgi:hypothetical protein
MKLGLSIEHALKLEENLGSTNDWPMTSPGMYGELDFESSGALAAHPGLRKAAGNRR